MRRIELTEWDFEEQNAECENVIRSLLLAGEDESDESESVDWDAIDSALHRFEGRWN
jgi:hypothetical protein